ncbi:LysM peptidoglycan-binding domain-containing protein [Tenuibacillus multivorans]|uniref:Stage VI sporulation protein D n=1 Tax=Tenuibacillus multivorans TaxID=237069 RepID=A0A1G9ZLP3_9BACI|nr:LysM domain-containing protein [Tenuibacillus multivorans]GEL77445.1 hypothetical protein TMU01_16800 [Tenuibacillus multivorans]SDN22269.1 stage VI sporulation protein D [Tenuibacillus multivorans]
MSTQENEPMLFDLHEQITFRQGEEIDDLYGISIQPDVNVIKESSYIQLRGVLMVSGDYQSLPREEPMLYVDNHEDDENYVQQVKALDNGFTTFQYPIPVDITLPSNRVAEINEPDVEVEYFDYELPEPGSLHVYTKIRLIGVEVAKEEARHEETHQETEVNYDFELKEVPSFEAEELGASELETDLGEVPEVNVEEEPAENEDKKGRDFWKKEKSQSLNEFFNKKEDKKDFKEEYNEEYDNEQYENVEYQDNMDYEEEEYAEKDDYHEPEQEYEDDGKEDGEEKPKKKKGFGLGYLSSFFREDEPERVSVKMRFVQENETLESIANAYEVSVYNLERINGLESGDELHAGDVLYVPYEKKSS